jgi:hypothetical protein
MDPTRTVVYVIAGCILALTLATGPVGVIQIQTPFEQMAAPGSGNASVTVESAPDSATIRGTSTGQNLRYLEVPPASISIASLDGNPTLTYSITIDELGHASNELYYLERVGEGRTQLAIDRASFEAGRITNESYRGTLRITLRTENGERMLLNRTVTVEVEE